jgi:VanZ family protein
MAWEIHAINFLPRFITKLKQYIAWIIVIVAFPFFFLGGPDATSSKLYGALWNCGHIVFFIALVFALNKKVDLSRWQYALLTLLVVFVGGGLIEVIQSYTGRDGNWDDLLRDLSGTCVGLFWLRPPSLSVWLGRVVALAFLVPSLSVVFFEAWFQYQAMKKFPLLAGFESSIELYGQKSAAELSTQFRTQGNYSLKLNLTTERYSGISFKHLFNDWSGFKQLSVDIYNPSSLPFTMVLRVNDIEHEKTGWVDEDRFNKRFQVSPGWNHLVFALNEIQKAPAKRLMDLSQISLIVIYAAQLPEARTIYLDNLKLE